MHEANDNTERICSETRRSLHNGDEVVTERPCSRGLQRTPSATVHGLHLPNTGGCATTGFEAGSEAESKQEESLKIETLKALQRLPSCPVTSRCLLPSVSAIYFLLRADECLYVGQSVNLRNRWATHEKILEVGGDEGLRLAWQPTSLNDLNNVERKMIAALRPRYNYNLIPRLPVVKVKPVVKVLVTGLTTAEAAERLGKTVIGTREAAERLGVSQQRIQALIKDGRLPAQMVGRDYLINEADLKLVEVRKTGRPPKPASKKA